MTLMQGTIGMKYEVVKLNVEERITRRLEALGINEKTKIEVLNRKKNGAMIIKVRGTRLAIGKMIAEGIIVILIEETPDDRQRGADHEKNN